MKTTITTLSVQRFLLISLLSAPVIMVSCLAIALETQSKGPVFLMIPLLGGVIYLGHRFSKSQTQVEITEGEFRVESKRDQTEIPLDHIVGYYLNTMGASQTMICFKLQTGETLKLTGSNAGVQGKIFHQEMDHVLTVLKEKNPGLKELKYTDVYSRQTVFLTPILWTAFGVTLIINLIAIFSMVSDEWEAPWQIFFVNFWLVALIPIFRKRKN